MTDEIDDVFARVFKNMAMDERFFQGDGRELNQRQTNAACQMRSISKRSFTVEVKRRRKIEGLKR